MTGHAALIPETPVASPASTHRSLVPVVDSHVAAEEAVGTLSGDAILIRSEQHDGTMGDCCAS